MIIDKDKSISRLSQTIYDLYLRLSARFYTKNLCRIANCHPKSGTIRSRDR